MEPAAVVDVDRTKVALLGPVDDKLVTADDAFIGLVVSLATVWVEVGWTDLRPLFFSVGLLAQVEVLVDLRFCEIKA